MSFQTLTRPQIHGARHHAVLPGESRPLCGGGGGKRKGQSTGGLAFTAWQTGFAPCDCRLYQRRLVLLYLLTLNLRSSAPSADRFTYEI